DWRSILLEQYSNDRNAAVVNEVENNNSAGLVFADSNGNPQKAQFLGTLAPNEVSGNDDRPVGFEIHGAISGANPTDRDVYSFSGSTGSEVWFQVLPLKL